MHVLGQEFGSICADSWSLRSFSTFIKAVSGDCVIPSPVADYG